MNTSRTRVHSTEKTYRELENEDKNALMKNILVEMRVTISKEVKAEVERQVKIIRAEMEKEFEQKFERMLN